MHINDQQRLVEAALEAVALTGQLGNVQALRPVRIGLGATLLRRQGREIGLFPLPAPGAQRRRIDPFAAHEGTDFAGLAAAVGFLQNSTLLRRREVATLRVGDDLGIGARIGHALGCGHRCLGLLLDCHTYLFAH